MARAALEWSLDEAANASGVSRRTVLRLEQGESLQPRNLRAIQRAYEEAGARFIDTGTNAGGVVAPPDGEVTGTSADAGQSS